jgi:hypothetical protein
MALLLFYQLPRSHPHVLDLCRIAGLLIQVRSDETPNMRKTGFSVPSGWVDSGSVCHGCTAMPSRPSAAMLLLSALIQPQGIKDDQLRGRGDSNPSPWIAPCVRPPPESKIPVLTDALPN